MRKFNFKILFFFLPIILLMFVADYIISNNLKKSHETHGEFEVWEDIYNGEINADLAVYGSSRAWVQIDPSILEDSLNLRAYNFGISGQAFWLQYLRHIEYLKFNKSPKLIILSVDSFTLHRKEGLFQPEQFMPYMLWNSDIRKYTSSYKNFTSLDYYFPFLRYIGNVKKVKNKLKLNHKNQTKYRFKGYRGMKLEWGRDSVGFESIMKQYETSIDSFSTNLVKQFFFECETKGIKVILVYTPAHIEGQKLVENRNEIINAYKDFAYKYNLIFLDYSKDILCKQREYYYDPQHLNKKGSEIFTKKLSHDLKILLK